MGAWRVLPYYLRRKEGKTMYKGYWLATMRLKAEFAAGHRTVAFAASLGHGCFFKIRLGADSHGLL
jgi:hypothetical protein